LRAPVRRAVGRQFDAVNRRTSNQTPVSERWSDEGLYETRFAESWRRPAAGAAVGADLRPARAQEPTIDLKPEAGASLRVLRPAKFVKGDETLWLENTEKYTKQTGVTVKVESQGWEDLRPKAAVAANVGKGPDIVYGWYDDAHQYPEKLVDVTDTAEYLDKKYGGWYDVCRKFGMRDGSGSPFHWCGRPASSHRISAPEGGRLRCLVDRFDGMLKGAALAAKGKPGGLALGNAAGDANGWCHWLAWCSAARWSTRIIKSYQQPGDHRRSNTRPSSTRRSCRAHCPGSTPPTTRRSSTARSPDHQRHSIYYAPRT
jgi:hypothetical protein